MCLCFSRESVRIPLIVTTCVTEVERRGLRDVGIYRVSGLSSEVSRLKKAFEKSTSPILLFPQFRPQCTIDQVLSKNKHIYVLSFNCTQREQKNARRRTFCGNLRDLPITVLSSLSCFGRCPLFTQCTTICCDCTC